MVRLREPAALDWALARLQAVLLEDPRAGTLWSDLAATYYVRAQEGEDPVDLVHALGAIEEARRWLPNDPVVLFNRALVLDRLNLLEEAEASWLRYLRVDSTSDWGHEARRRLDSLRSARREGHSGREPPCGSSSAARRFIQGEVLEAWSAEAAGDTVGARESLGTASRCAERRERQTGDVLLSHSVARLLEAMNHEDDEAIEALFQGHRLYSTALALTDQGAYAEASPLFRQAARRLRRGQSPFALWADFEELGCRFQARRFSAVAEGGSFLLQSLSDEGPSELRAQTWGLLGTSRFALGDLSGARRAYQEARREYRRLADLPRLIANEGQLGDLADWLGRVEEAWRRRYEALSGLRHHDDPQRRRLILLGAGFAAADLGEPESARVLLDEVVSLARQAPDPLSLVNALLKRGSLLARLGDGTAALADFTAAEEHVSSIVDPDRQRFTRAELLVEMARTLAESSPAVARTRLEEALALSRSGEARLLEPDVLIELARCDRKLGELAKAKDRLLVALRLLEEQRRTVGSDVERIALADRTDRAFDEVVLVLLRADDPVAALAVADQARFRRARERLGDETRKPDLSTLIEKPPHPWENLPKGSAVLLYSVMPDRLLIWVMDRGGMQAREVRVASRDLQRWIGELRDSRRRVGSDGEATLERLDRVLIEPVRAEIAAASELFIAADRELYFVPFGALREKESGRYLLQDASVTVIPFMSGRPGQAERPTSAPTAGQLGPSVVVFADPSIDRSRHPDLTRLPGARSEAEAIAQIYPGGGRIVTDAAATPAALRRELRLHAVTHVAAHTEVDPRNPLRSALILAPGAGAGELTAEELLRIDPGACRVVILATCDSSGIAVSRSEGPLGLTWPLLAVGIPNVVSTLWPIGDRESAPLFTAFHRELSRGVPVSAALRRAQLESMEQGVGVWAAPVAYGFPPSR